MRDQVPRGVPARCARAIAAAALLACGGCAAGFRIVAEEDPFFQTSSRRMVGNVLEPRRGGDWVTMDAEARRAGADSVRYTIVVRVRSTEGFLGIAPGESLILRVDSARIALASPGPAARGRRFWGTREEARYPVSPALIRRIGEAREVRVRVVGRRHYLDRVLSAENIRRFSDFAASGRPGGTPSVH